MTDTKNLIQYKLYMHSDKSDMLYEGTELGLNEKALENFIYCGYEVGIAILVDKDTGKCYATHLNDVALEKRVEI